mmetsp:Transcript_147/g.398  ORF Transcript_147/g.398 Transcript_147/m.398 type:complete len:144 (+) Transcript_147:81-512(+)
MCYGETSQVAARTARAPGAAASSRKDGLGRDLESDAVIAAAADPFDSSSVGSESCGAEDMLCASSPCRRAARKRCVSFSRDGDDVHEVTPYSEVYGVHPRTFNFGRHMSMLPAVPASFGRFFDDDEDSEDEAASDNDEAIMLD